VNVLQPARINALVATISGYITTANFEAFNPGEILTYYPDNRKPAVGGKPLARVPSLRSECYSYLQPLITSVQSPQSLPASKVPNAITSIHTSRPHAHHLPNTLSQATTTRTGSLYNRSTTRHIPHSADHASDPSSQRGAHVSNKKILDLCCVYVGLRHTVWKCESSHEHECRQRGERAGT
jgi:hypothetical protein